MKIKKNGKVIRLTESDLKKIIKRVLTEQEYIANANSMFPDTNMSHTYTLQNRRGEDEVENPSRVKVLSNEGFSEIEDKDAVEVMMCGGSVNKLPNLMEFPNLFVINCSGCEPLVDINVDSILNNKRLSRVIFNYVDSPIMNSKVNALLNSTEHYDTKLIIANKVENQRA